MLGAPPSCYPHFHRFVFLLRVPFLRLNNFNIQVQHTHMTDTAAADHATVELIVNTLHWVFPSFDYRYSWMLSSCSI